MNDQSSDPALIRRLHAITRLSAILVIVIGGLGVMGWLLNIASFKSVAPGLATMKFNTALAFILVGIGVANLPRRERLAQVTVAIVLLLGALTLVEYLSGWNFGIDQLLILDNADTQFPGRMSIITASNFTLLGTALWCLSARRYFVIAKYLTLVALVLSMIILLGYVYGAEQLYGLFRFTSVSIQAAIAFVLACIGLLLLYPEYGPLRIIAFSSAGGYVFRRILPVFGLIPLFGWLRWQGELVGLYGTELGLVLFTLTNVLLLAVVTLRLGHNLHTIDHDRLRILDSLRRASAELELKVEARTNDLWQTNQALEKEIAQRKQKEAEFRTLLESAPDAIVIVNEEGEISLINHQAESIFGYSSAELIGKSVETLIPAPLHSRHVAHRAHYVENPVVREMGIGLDLYAQRKDGTHFPVEISLSSIQLEDDILIFSAIRDITERKRVEQALREKDEQLQTIFDLLPMGASLVNSDRQLTRMNLALERILDMNMPDLLQGKYRARQYIHSDGTPLQPSEFASERAFQEQRPVLDVEVGVVKEDGTTIWTSVSAAPLPSNHGVVIVTADVTARRLAEMALREREEQFRATFDFASIGMALVWLTGEWGRVNQAVCEIVGYPREELLRMTFQEITHPDDLDLDLTNIHQLLANEIQSYHMEKRYLHKEGHIVWVLLSVSLVRDTLGAPMYFVSQIQNITDRKLAEEALRMSLVEEQKFQNLLKALQEITVELTLVDDLDEFYKRAVQLGLERLGFERLGLLLYDKQSDKAIGTYGTDANGNLVAEDHIQLEPSALTSILLRALQEKVRFVLDEKAELFDNFKSLGVGWNAVAVLWNGTENTGWLAADNGVEHKPVSNSMLDILHLYSLTLGTLLVQKQTFIDLQNSESRFRRAITNSPFPIMIHAEDGEVLNLSNVWSEISGYTPEELPTTAAWTERAYGEQKNTVLERIRQIYQRDSPISVGESAIRTKSGQIRIWDLIAAPLGRLPDGRFMVSSMAMDITERKQAEEVLHRLNDQLTQANREVQQFAYIVSHDLRAPLINLKGFSEILRATVEQLQSFSTTITPVLDAQQSQLWQTAIGEKIPTAVRFINLAVDRMDKFTAAILKLSRLGHRLIAHEPIQTQELVQQIVNSLLPQTDSQDIEITVEELPNIEADRIDLDQIFGNIIANAIKYLDPKRKGQIVIYGEQDKLQTTFYVKDNGRGIDPAYHDRVFAPFRRGISDVEGEGMGLAYVQALVKRYQGRIWFESTLDVGTIVAFTIPKRKVEPDEAF